nr:MAG TPA: hypothetical protein [Caudoviricetes sp.]DAN43123.1 MAG TPA: hypothetical protein [Caudoviricetes sp.]DAQ52082.1 MAG TPA: hypothetical protein [Caudoviricetes sp.]DAW54918.1 MAG TPA: hypothetical protein [Caudoviricetes sp.]
MRASWQALFLPSLVPVPSEHCQPSGRALT